MNRLLERFWEYISDKVRTVWDFLARLLDHALQFLDEVFTSISDFFDHLFEGITDALLWGRAKLWEIWFGSDDSESDNALVNARRVFQQLVNTYNERNANRKAYWSIGMSRIVVKTDMHDQIQNDDDIRFFIVRPGTSMSSMDDALKASGGIMEIRA